MAQIHENSDDDTASSAPVQSPFKMTALYVADIDPDVTDDQFYDFFNQVGQVVSVRICKDYFTQQSLGYGYVNFSNAPHAETALEVLNFTPLNNKPIRLMYSNRDPSSRKRAANIFVKNLDEAIDNKALHDTFSAFGKILSCKIATDASGQSKGYGFVQFEKEESAKDAIETLNGMLMNDKRVYVGHFQRKQDREKALNNAKFSNVYVKNLSETMTEGDLMKTFGEYGTITSAVVMRYEDGRSKCFGFVNFENADAAAKAVEALNGKKFDDKEWYVAKAQKKSERELELKERHEHSVKEAFNKYPGSNLYLKNLDDSINDETLKDLFAEYGTITSHKIMRDPSGISRGSGFVSFSTPEEAVRAIGAMNGQMVAGKPLYVALAERKEERQARLQAQFAQRRPVAMAPPIAPPHTPLYPPGAPAPAPAPGMGQQFLYRQPPPAMIPQAGYVYPQQLVPVMRPVGVPPPNILVPLIRHPVGRRVAGPTPMYPPQQPVPLMQQQMLPGGHVPSYPPGPYMGAQRPWDIMALATALANAPPEQQKNMLGEVLFPLVDKLEHEAAAKVTGMLLEMDQTEVLHLIESPDALRVKVAEAMDVLSYIAQQQSNNPADQLASLSLDDRHLF